MKHNDEKQEEREGKVPIYVKRAIHHAMKAAASARGMKLSEYIESRLTTGGKTK